MDKLLKISKEAKIMVKLCWKYRKLILENFFSVNNLAAEMRYATALSGDFFSGKCNRMSHFCIKNDIKEFFFIILQIA